MSWTYSTINPVGRQMQRVMEELRLALVERCSISATTVPVGWTTSIDGRQVTATMLSTWHTAISTLIPKFANHTYNSGDFDGALDVIVWSEASILSSIGDASRLSISSGNQITAAWLGQQYNILDRLRWLRLSAPTNSNVNPQQKYSDPDSGLSYTQAGAKAGAESSFAIADIETDSTACGVNRQIQEAMINGSPGYYAFIQSRICAFRIPIISGTFSATADCYMRPTDNYLITEYYNFGMPDVSASNTTMKMFGTSILDPGVTYLDTPVVGDFTLTGDWGTLEAFQGWFLYEPGGAGFRNGAVYAVVKMDGVGGFTYIS